MQRLRLLLVLLLFAAGLGPAGAGERETAIRGVISAQIEAFRADDAGTAFAFASPAIQNLFRTPAAFIAMVRRGYVQVYRPRSFTFLPLETDAEGRLLQPVLVQGPDGDLVRAVYEMVEIEGRWRINGCAIERGEDS
jgi:hypothetical protein